MCRFAAPRVVRWSFTGCYYSSVGCAVWALFVRVVTHRECVDCAFATVASASCGFTVLYGTLYYAHECACGCGERLARRRHVGSLTGRYRRVSRVMCAQMLILRAPTRDGNNAPTDV